ncbi:MAG: hypothetical protein GY847_21180, partial [Proteobacteria bacterium]|nr:hypothetical protein [Pseudomonadota bacterium]
SEWEVKLVRYALEHLTDENGTAFTKGRLVDAGLGKDYQIYKLSQQWGDEGLLVKETRGHSLNEQWWITPKLAALARI